MKILFVTKHYRPGAGDRSYMFNLEKLLRRKGHSVGYFAMDYPGNLASPFSKYFVSNITFENALRSKNPLHWAKVLLRSFYSLESRSRINQLLQDYRPDLVHVHSLDTHLTYSILPAIRKNNIPIIWTLHTFAPVCINYFLYNEKEGRVCEACKPGRFYMAALKRCKKGSLPASVIGSQINYFNHTMNFFKFVDAFICPSAFVKNKFIEFNFSPEKLFLVPNFVNLSGIPHHAGGKYGIYIGRIEREKGVYSILQALEGTEIPFKFIGDGHARDGLIKKAKKMNLRQVEFTGFKAGNELKSLISGALFSVAPSLLYEVGPLTIIEAFSFAKPVIGFGIGGIPEVIEEDETGFIIDDMSSEALRKKMIVLYNDPQKASIMGQRARRYVESAHSPERHYDQIFKIYSRCVSAASKAVPSN